MKNKFTLIALLALFLAGTYTIYAQEENEYTPTPETAPATEEVVAEEGVEETSTTSSTPTTLP